MQTPIALAIEQHALAICAWSLSERPAYTPAETARRVETARACSKAALSAGSVTGVYRRYPDENNEYFWFEEIEAACRDAEARAAIEAHSACIDALCDLDRDNDKD
jgi:hypothetical protein